MRWYLDRKIAAAFTAVLFSVGMLGALAYTSMTSFVKSSWWALHAQTVLAEVDDVPLKLEEAESAQLQYLLTNDAQFRTAFQTVAKDAETELDEVRRLTAGSPVQRERVGRLTELLKGRIASLQAAVTAKDTNGTDEALHALEAGTHPTNKAEFHAIIQELEQTEQQQVTRHEATATTRARTMRRRSVAASGLACGLVVLAGFLLNRDVLRRRRAEAALRDSEERYRTLVENTTEGIVSLTLEGQISSVNRGLETMLDWSREELVGESYGKILTPTSMAQSEERLRHALAVERLPSPYEAETVRKDGNIVPVEVRADLVRDGTGQVIGVLALHRDISIRKALEQSQLAHRSGMFIP